MKHAQVAPRYARALLNVALELEKVEEYQRLLIAVSEIYSRLKNVFDNPTIGARKQVTRLVELLTLIGLSVDEPFKNFLSIVFEKKRQKILPLLARYFELMKIETQMKVPVMLSMPYVPSEEEIKILKLFVQKRTKREPVFDIQVNPKLIAGAVLEYDGKTLDVSVHGRMERIIRAIFEKR